MPNLNTNRVSGFVYNYNVASNLLRADQLPSKYSTYQQAHHCRVLEEHEFVVRDLVPVPVIQLKISSANAVSINE